MDELIPIIAVGAPFALVMTLVSLKHKAKSRELLHAEKMKALELGLAGGMGGSSGWPAIVALGIGAIMPATVFLFAWLASMTGHSNEEAWLTAALVGGGGVIGGTRLGFRVLKEREQAAAALAARHDDARARLAQANGQAHRKPTFNPDAYDAIAHRG
jgi:hypothetical protein